jgi:cytochrome c5
LEPFPANFAHEQGTAVGLVLACRAGGIQPAAVIPPGPSVTRLAALTRRAGEPAKQRDGTAMWRALCSTCHFEGICGERAQKNSRFRPPGHFS